MQLTITEFIEVAQKIEADVKFHRECADWYSHFFNRHQMVPGSITYTHYQKFLQFMFTYHFERTVKAEQTRDMLVGACKSEFCPL